MDIKPDVAKIIKIAKISRDMAYKYIRGDSLPRLDTAVLLEEKLNIPVTFWVNRKNDREKRLQK